MSIYYSFEVVSKSSGEVYTLDFSKINETVKFGCSCPAGSRAGYCKHREAILKGDVSAINQRDALDAATVSKLIVNTEIGAILTELAELEFEIEAKKKKQKNLKKMLGRVLEPN